MIDRFTEAVAAHARHLRAMRRSPKTLSWYAEQLAAYDAWRVDHGLPDALPDAETIDAYIGDQHGRGLAPSTVNARFRALRAVCNFLERRRQLARDDNPMHLLDPPSVPKVRRRYVAAADFAALLRSIVGHSWLDERDRLILHLLYYSGLRLAELVALQVSDVDVTALEILVRSGKGEKSRLVPTVPEIRPVFAAYLYSRPNHTAELLLKSDGYGGSAGALRAEGVRQMLIRRCRAAGVEYYNPHAFRHAFAMWLLNGGARLTTVSEAMGHSDPNVTHAIYAHTTTTTVRREYDEAAQRLRGHNT